MGSLDWTLSPGDCHVMILDWTLHNNGPGQTWISTGDIFLAGTPVMAIHAIAVREAPRENGSLILDFEQRVGGGPNLNPKLEDFHQLGSTGPSWS